MTLDVLHLVLVTSMISLVLQGKPHTTISDLEAIIQQAVQLSLPLLDSQYIQEFMDHVVPDDSESSLERLKLDEPGAIGYTFKCMGSGVWGFRSQRPFKDMLNLLIRFKKVCRYL